MGFLDTLFAATGGDQYAAAYNAVLMEYTIPRLSADVQQRLIGQLLPTMRSGGFANQPDSYFIDMMVESGRIVQLNFMALALCDIGVPPALPTKFVSIRNPADPKNELPDIWVKVKGMEADFLKQHGVSISVPNHPIQLRQIWAPLSQPHPTSANALNASHQAQNTGRFNDSSGFDDLYGDLEEQYDNGDLCMHEYMLGFRKIILDEVRELIKCK